MPHAGIGASAGAAAATSGGCFLEWHPFEKDRVGGLSHQLSSLSCALYEAHHLGRTLLLPRAGLCMVDGHAARWRSASMCTDWDELLDLPLLSRLVSVQARRDGVPADGVVDIGANWTTSAAHARLPCSASARTVRRHVHGYWYTACQKHAVDTSRLTRAVRERLGARAAIRPLQLLASGLWYARRIKRAAAAVRQQLGGAYAWLHVRRTDRLRIGCAHGVDCDALTRPAALEAALANWLPDGSNVYVGSDEPADFFAPLGARYRLYFAENFSAAMRHARNNNELYAAETLISFGAAAYVETYAYYKPTCFPASAAIPASAPTATDPISVTALCPAETGGGVSVNGVAFAAGCARLEAREFCARGMRLVPPPPNATGRCAGGENAVALLKAADCYRLRRRQRAQYS